MNTFFPRSFLLGNGLSRAFQKILFSLSALGSLVAAGILCRFWLFKDLAIEWGQMILMLTLLLFLFPLVGVLIWRNFIKKMKQIKY